MSALKKKIAEKKAAEQKAREQQQQQQQPAAQAPSPAVAQSLDAKAPSKAAPSYKKGFLESGTLLYPEGSNEAAPKMWRGRDPSKKVFALHKTESGYEIRGEFREAGRYLGKEDFEVTRDGLNMRIRGNPAADEQSLVRGLDETIALPPDTDVTAAAADYYDCTLTIKLPRSQELHELLKHLTLEQAEELATKHGLPSLREWIDAKEEGIPAGEAGVEYTPPDSKVTVSSNSSAGELEPPAPARAPASAPASSSSSSAPTDLGAPARPAASGEPSTSEKARFVEVD